MTKHASGKYGRTIGQKERKAGWPAPATAWCYLCNGTHRWAEGCAASDRECNRLTKFDFRGDDRSGFLADPKVFADHDGLVTECGRSVLPDSVVNAVVMLRPGNDSPVNSRHSGRGLGSVDGQHGVHVVSARRQQVE